MERIKLSGTFYFIISISMVVSGLLIMIGANSPLTILGGYTLLTAGGICGIGTCTGKKY